jgi:DNA-binding Xre family transcriptional regulator
MRALRHKTGLNQRQLAKRLGISQATLARLEGGSQNTKLEIIDRLCRTLQCDIGDLFSGRVTAPSRRRKSRD